jgi:hypothetical protein
MTTLYGRHARTELNRNFQGWEELEDDASVKVNHHTCTAGTDTRNRFGIKRVDGAYLFHCFNCGQSGYYRQQETISRIKLASALVTTDKGVEDIRAVYDTSNRKYDEFDLRGQLWLGQYQFDDLMCKTYGIRECNDGIILPIHKTSDVLPQGFQIRRYDKKPKYLTYRGNAKAQYIKGNPSKPLVVVEDLLSSYKLNFAQYSTLCLMGTSLSLKTLEELHVDRSNRVVIWLDDDEAGEAGMIKIYRELSPLFSGGITSIHMQQPKEIDIDKLMEMDL